MRSGEASAGEDGAAAALESFASTRAQRSAAAAAAAGAVGDGEGASEGAEEPPAPEKGGQPKRGTSKKRFETLLTASVELPTNPAGGSQTRKKGIKRSHDELWESTYDLLRRYTEREGDADVPKGHEEGGVRLGLWIRTQRAVAKKGEMSQLRKSRLETLGLTWEPLDAQWERNFALLEAFRAREGHANVHKAYDEQGVKLGWWLNTQRSAYKKGELSDPRRRRLEEAGVAWDIFDTKWEQTRSLLAAYLVREGNSNVPKDHIERGVKLGWWLRTQRAAAKRGELHHDRRQALDDLGITWDMLDSQWERSHALLVRFRDREGHVNVPLAHDEDGVKLGHWIRTQRTAQKKGEMPVDRIQALEALGLRWRATGDDASPANNKAEAAVGTKEKKKTNPSSSSSSSSSLEKPPPPSEKTDKTPAASPKKKAKTTAAAPSPAATTEKPSQATNDMAPADDPPPTGDSPPKTVSL